MSASKYLVCANESSAEGSKNFNNSWTAVASDIIIGSYLGHVGSPANMLPHYDSQVSYKECILLRLRKRETYIEIYQKKKHTLQAFA